MIEHCPEDGIERKLRVKQSGGFKQQIKLAQAAANGLGARDVLDARKQIGQRLLAGSGARAEDHFVGIFETEGNGIAVIQEAALDFFAVDKKTAALAAIFDVQAARFDNQRRAIARDAAIRKLKMIAGFCASADQKWGLRDAHVAASAVR